MQEIPFNIPKSLSSYVEKFENEPEKVIGKLKKHLKRRGPDAVGHFLLSWFYHLQDKSDLAVREALKAKTFAPGSPLMEHLHYFLVHPEKFEAALPSRSFNSSTRSLQRANRSSPVLDLDRLIAMLEAVESNRITMPAEGEEDERDLSRESEHVDDVVSETLAKIHAMQGRKNEAITMYEKLRTLHPDKKEYFGEQIEQLKKSGK